MINVVKKSNADLHATMRLFQLNRCLKQTAAVPDTCADTDLMLIEGAE